MLKKKSYCSNCGKYGHINKYCSEPVISVGIICVKLDDILKNIILFFTLKALTKNYQ